MTRPINWELVSQQYDEMIKYTTALKLGTANPESILRRFTRNNVQHPTYRALSELGKAVKTIFLCRYIGSEALRREINEGLNVVENWNSANSFIFFGKGGEVATNRLEDQEVVGSGTASAANLSGLYQYADDSTGVNRTDLAITYEIRRLPSVISIDL